MKKIALIAVVIAAGIAGFVRMGQSEDCGRCSFDSDCPGGQVCRAGYCETPQAP
ncbi:MAG: hypothetical protein HY549_07690 [Elusimicrobia bacterium]|nr:hypothetical protein [Elusimicrobiota bacterium]